MNERIQELIDQSRDLIQTKVMLGGQVYVPGPLMPGDVNLEKFAKLIVQECASICYNSNLQDSDLHAQNLLYEFNIDNARNLK
jgi:hypothetical protein